MEEEKDELIVFQPADYQTEGSSIGPDRRPHHVVWNDKLGRFAYVYNKKDRDDGSFLAPYLMHNIGKKIGMKVPRTELGIYLEKDIDKRTYMESFYETSLVYINNKSKYTLGIDGLSHIDAEVAQGMYLEENREEAKRIREESSGRKLPITIEEYINSNIYLMTTRGEKPESQYTAEEKDTIRQELIERAMFELKFGVHLKTAVTLFNHGNAKLDPCYLSSSNMFSLNVRPEWIDKQLKKEDNEFKKQIDEEYKSHYGIPPNTFVPSTKEVLNYMYNKYPKQTEKAYKKICSYTKKDLEEELSACPRLDDNRKQFALRVFETRQREFEEVHREQMKKEKDERE